MKLEVSFLGGVGEIGANCYVYETETAAIIIDSGLKFFQHEYLGIDYTIPDFEYLEQIRHKLKAVVITHGHEDHTGALSFLFKKFPLPLYAGNYATRLIKHKIAESRYRPKSFNLIQDMDKLDFGDIHIEVIQITHSIPDTFFIVVEVKGKKYLHCGDFRIENQPLLGVPFPEERIKALKNEIDGLFIDTTNIFDINERQEEITLHEPLLKIMKDAEGRIFITTFSTNISRIKLVIDVCIKTGKKLVVEGNSFNKNINIARDLGYLTIPPELIVPLEHIDRYDDCELCFLVTGCQGEPNSALSKITKMERKQLKIKDGDLFIFSSKTIPGNEKNVISIKNDIYLNNGSVKDDIHISGHACQKDILYLINELMPKFTIPIHGEPFNQKLLENLIKDYDFTETIFVENGNKIVFSDEGYILRKIPSGITYIDQRMGMEYDTQLFKEKRSLARDGIIIVHWEKDDFTYETVGFKNTNELDTKLKRYIKEQMEILVSSCENKDILKEGIAALFKRFYKKNYDMKPIVKVYMKEDTNGII